MADETVTQAGPEALRLQAHYQIDAMCGAMLNAAQANDGEALPYLVQSLTIRINALNDAVMMSASDTENPEAISNLRKVVSHV